MAFMKTEEKMNNDWLDLQGRRYELNCKGYLVDPAAWDERLLAWFAEQEQLEISNEHREVIFYLRSYFAEQKVHPVVRVISKAMVGFLGQDKGSMAYFHKLFPGGIHQAFRVAGLPMQHSCC